MDLQRAAAADGAGRRDVPLTNVHTFCNQEYYGNIANVIRRWINDYLEATGK